MYFSLKTFFESLSFIWHVIYLFRLSVMSFPFLYFTLKIILLPFHPVVGMFSFILYFLADRIFFRYFEMFSFDCIASPCLGIFSVFYLSPVSFLLCFQVALTNMSSVLFYSFYPNISKYVFPSLTISLVIAISLPVFTCLISHSGFLFLFGFLRRTPILSQSYFAPATDNIADLNELHDHLSQRCCQLGYLVMISLSFRFLT